MSIEELKQQKLAEARKDVATRYAKKRRDAEPYGLRSKASKIKNTIEVEERQLQKQLNKVSQLRHQLEKEQKIADDLKRLIEKKKRQLRRAS